MSASRWASNDDASDEEEDDRQSRQARRERRWRRGGRKAGTPGSAAEAAAGDGRGGGSAGVVGGSDGDGEAGDSEEEEEDEKESLSSGESVERGSGEVAAVVPGKGQDQAAVAAAAAAAAGGGDVRSSEVQLLRATTGEAQTAWRENFGDGGDATTQQQRRQGAATGKLHATIASTGRESGDGGGRGGRPSLRRGSTGEGKGMGADGGVGDDAEDAEDAMVRCGLLPLYFLVVGYRTCSGMLVRDGVSTSVSVSVSVSASVCLGHDCWWWRLGLIDANRSLDPLSPLQPSSRRCILSNRSKRWLSCVCGPLRLLAAVPHAQPTPFPISTPTGNKYPSASQ